MAEPPAPVRCLTVRPSTIGFFVATAFFLAACGGPDVPHGYVSRADLGDRWPLTVPSGVLGCQGNSISFTSGSTTYAINGTAKNLHPEWPDIEAIWAFRPDSPGIRMDIGPLLERGRKLC